MKQTFYPLILFLFSFNHGSSQEELKLERIEGVSTNERIDDIKVYKDNQAFVAGSAGLYSISSTTLLLKKESDQFNNTAVAITRKGNVYSSTKDGRIFLDGKLLFVIKPELLKEVTDMEVYKGKLWVGSTSGLFVYNISLGKLISHHKAVNSKLRSNKINFIHADKNNKLWVGTDQGFVEIEDKKWKSESTKESFLAITEVDEGVFLLSDKDLILIQHTGRLNSMGLSKGLSKGDVNDLTVDSDGYLYIASDILIRYDPFLDRIDQYSDLLGIVSQKCLSLASDGNQNLWLGTSDAGLFRIYTGDFKLDVLQVLALVESPINCYGERTGSIQLNVSGGEPPYKFEWDSSRLRGESPSTLGAGEYNVTITDKYENSVSAGINIIEPSKIDFNIIESNRVSGPGEKDGTALIDIFGGVAPYSVSWSNGEIGMHAKALKAGSHRVRIVDSNGCDFSRSVEIEKEKFIPELDIAKISVGQTLSINNLFFEADSSVITEISYEVLDEVYDFLSDHELVVIEIGGHTNDKPPHAYCDKLSTSRARNVAEYLFNKGISEKRISYIGYGKRKPKYSNRTKDGQRKNQRVEVKIVSIN